ncbi:MAG: NrfD/PsrC family molybdoenzyme membrane anchor subunit [Bacillota bacterium]
MLSKNKLVLVSLLLICIGAAGGINILIQGEHALGINNQVPWGILIAGYVFFALSSTGIGLVSSLGHVFGLEQYELLGKRALLASIVILLCGFGMLALELANPLKLIYILISPNLKSPIWWMGAFYSIYLVLLFAEFYYALKDNHHKVKPIANLALVIKLAAATNLGFVFGMLHARPYWQGPYFSLYMVLTAIVSGAALLSVIFYLAGKNGANVFYKDSHITTSLGKILAAALVLTAVFTIVHLITGIYGNIPGKSAATAALLTGPLSLKFWFIEIGMGLALPLYLLLKYNFQIHQVFRASVLAIAGVLLMRIDFVLAGQIIPLQVIEGLTVKGYNKYVASWSEWSVILGALGMAAFLYMAGESFFRLDVFVEESDEKGNIITGKKHLSS